MSTFLLVTLLLAFLLHPAAAASPSMDPALHMAPLESSYPDPDGMLICELCGISIELCTHIWNYVPRRAPTFTAETFLDHPEWPHDAAVFDTLSEPEPVPTFPQPFLESSPLRDDVIRQLEENATTVQLSTVQIHVEETYTPGDRLASTAEPRRPSHRRQQPRPDGFPCTECERRFDRACDLKRHQKTHLIRSERPHKCSVCGEGFLYPKDRSRHERTHSQSSSAQATLYCCVPGCSNVDGFSRRDNLLRHQRKQHPHLIASS